MSFQDPPSRPRYPALAQYEEQRPASGYTDFFDDSRYQSDGPDAGGWTTAQPGYSSEAGYTAPNEYAAANGGYEANGYEANGYQQNGYQANGYQANGYEANGYQQNQYQQNGYQANGYQQNGYQPGAEFGGQGGGYPAAARQGSAGQSWRSGDDSWRSGDDHGWSGRSRQPDSDGMLAGAVTGFLALAVAIGIATLVAGISRAQASPLIATGDAFINHAPSALKSFALHHYGRSERKMLFGVMYVIIAIIAVIVGIFAHRKVAIGVAGIWLFGLIAAFATVILPGSHPTDVIPALIGSVVGMLALIYLIRSSYADKTTRAPVRRRASAIGAR